MSLTDEQVRDQWDAACRAIDAANAAKDAFLTDMTKMKEKNEVLLADRAALLAEIAELKTRMAEGFSAREGQVDNGAKMIAGLQAENAKLRRVVEAARVVSQRLDKSYPPALPFGTRADQLAYSDLVNALAALEPANVPDAALDKG